MLSPFLLARIVGVRLSAEPRHGQADEVGEAAGILCSRGRVGRRSLQSVRAEKQEIRGGFGSEPGSRGRDLPGVFRFAEDAREELRGALRRGRGDVAAEPVRLVDDLVSVARVRDEAVDPADLRLEGATSCASSVAASETARSALAIARL
jgi:hypothetical protein